MVSSDESCEPLGGGSRSPPTPTDAQPDRPAACREPRLGPRDRPASLRAGSHSHLLVPGPSRSTPHRLATTRPSSLQDRYVGLLRLYRHPHPLRRLERCVLSLPLSPSPGCAAHAPPPVARSVRLVRDRPAVPALPHHRLDLDLRPRLRPHRTRPRPHPRDQRLEAVPRVLGRPVRRPRGQRGARLHGPRARREGAVQTVAEQAQPRPPAVPRPRRRRPLGVPPHPPSPRLLRPTLVAQHAVLPPDAHLRSIQPRPPRRRPPHPGLPPRDPPARVAAARQPEPVRLPRHRLHPARLHPERQKRAGELAPRQGVDRRQLLAPVARPGHRPPRPPPLLLLDHPGALYFFSSTIFL